tara:strand:- start:1965 stop:2348 length:384 start_codon:yes stop_codon:yes gene_type:complete
MKSIGKHIWAFAVSITSKLYDSTGSSGSPDSSVNVDLSSSSTGYGKILTTDGRQIYWTNATYIHNQSSTSATWAVTHNLNRFPAVTVINSADTVVQGTIVYNTANKLTITFFSEGDALAFQGKAYLN